MMPGHSRLLETFGRSSSGDCAFLSFKTAMHFLYFASPMPLMQRLLTRAYFSSSLIFAQNFAYSESLFSSSAPAPSPESSRSEIVMADSPDPSSSSAPELSLVSTGYF